MRCLECITRLPLPAGGIAQDADGREVLLQFGCDAVVAGGAWAALGSPPGSAISLAISPAILPASCLCVIDIPRRLRADSARPAASAAMAATPLSTNQAPDRVAGAAEPGIPSVSDTWCRMRTN